MAHSGGGRVVAAGPARAEGAVVIAAFLARGRRFKVALAVHVISVSGASLRRNATQDDGEDDEEEDEDAGGQQQSDGPARPLVRIRLPVANCRRLDSRRSHELKGCEAAVECEVADGGSVVRSPEEGRVNVINIHPGDQQRVLDDDTAFSEAYVRNSQITFHIAALERLFQILFCIRTQTPVDRGRLVLQFITPIVVGYSQDK